MASRFTTPHKIVVLGDGGVGKTALTIQLCLQHFIETVSPLTPPLYRAGKPPFRSILPRRHMPCDRPARPVDECCHSIQASPCVHGVDWQRKEGPQISTPALV